MRIFIFLLVLFSFTSSAEWNIHSAFNESNVRSVLGGPVTKYKVPVKSSVGRYAIATLNPKSISGVGRFLATKNPYTIAALAAASYFYDDFGNLLGKPEDTTPMPTLSPKLSNEFCVTARGNPDQKGCGATEYDAKFNACELVASQSLPYSTDPWPVREYTAGYCKVVGSTFYAYNNVTTCYQPNSAGNQTCYYDSPNRIKSIIFENDMTQENNAYCPPDSDATYTYPITDSTGQVTACTTPSDFATRQPVMPPLQQVADDWYNQSILDLQNYPIKTMSYENGSLNNGFIESVNSPNISDSFNSALNLVESGNYQTTDSTLPNYISPEMLNSVNSARNAMFNDLPFSEPDGTIVDSQNQPVNNPTNGTGTQPADTPINVNVSLDNVDFLTQTQYEQSNQKFFNEFSQVADSYNQTNETAITDLKDKEQSFIDSLVTDVQNAELPEMPTLSSIFPSIPTGQCIPFTLNVSLAGQPKTIVFDKHCPAFTNFVDPILVFFLYVSTALYVFHLAGRTFSQSI